LALNDCSAFHEIPEKKFFDGEEEIILLATAAAHIRPILHNYSSQDHTIEMAPLN